MAWIKKMDGEHDRAKTNTNFWQAKTEHALTAEDHRQIRDNLTGFFEILNEWYRKEHGNVC
jgi:hypothetical protein